MTDANLNLLSDYLTEASKYLEEMESLLLRMASKTDNTELKSEIFGPIHSIKRAARVLAVSAREKDIILPE